MATNRPRRVHRGTILVESRAWWTQADATRAGLSQWCIAWQVRTRKGAHQLEPEPLGVRCWNDLSIHVAPPDNAIGYWLYPALPGQAEPTHHLLNATRSDDVQPGQMTLPGWQ